MMAVNTGLFRREDLDLLKSDRNSWIPKKYSLKLTSRISAEIRGDDLFITEFNSLDQPLITHSNYDESFVYELQAVISQIHIDHEQPHLIAEVKGILN